MTIDKKTNDLLSWTSLPLFKLAEDIKALFEYTNLVSGSISLIADPEVKDFLIKELYVNNVETRDKIKNLCLKAQQEQENNLQHLIYQYIITLFSYLYYGIKNFITSVFKYMPESLEAKEIKSIEISITEFRKKNADELAHYIYSEYEKIVTKGEMYGVVRFEKLLKPIGFDGKVSKEIIRDIFELARLRNIIVHNGGVADATIIKLCPQLNLEFERKVIITREQLNRYTISTIGYLTILSNRVSEYVKNNVDKIFTLDNTEE